MATAHGHYFYSPRPAPASRTGREPGHVPSGTPGTAGPAGPSCATTPGTSVHLEPGAESAACDTRAARRCAAPLTAGTGRAHLAEVTGTPRTAGPAQPDLHCRTWAVRLSDDQRGSQLVDGAREEQRRVPLLGRHGPSAAPILRTVRSAQPADRPGIVIAYRCGQAWRTGIQRPWWWWFSGWRCGSGGGRGAGAVGA